MVNMLTAMNAYKSQIELAMKETSLSKDEAASTSGPSFSDLLKGQVDDVVSTQKAAESAKIDTIKGTGDVTELVTAIANAEMALNTIVTVRDRVITAYQDIIRMPI